MSSEQRKVLEDIQRAKRLLKEGAAVSHGIHTSSATAGPLITNTTQVFPASTSAGIGDMMFSPGMRNAKQVLSQANMTSFGFFIPQDSHFGNSILPVLPRIDPPASVPATSTTANSTATPSSTASSSSGNGQ